MNVRLKITVWLQFTMSFLMCLSLNKYLDTLRYHPRKAFVIKFLKPFPITRGEYFTTRRGITTITAFKIHHRSHIQSKIRRWVFFTSIHPKNPVITFNSGCCWSVGRTWNETNGTWIQRYFAIWCYGWLVGNTG